MHQQFSKYGHIIASAGAAVGIANLVILPARAHNYGGLAFILCFVLFTFILGIPLMIGEINLGKNGQSDAVTAYRSIGGKRWGYAGILGLITSCCILSFYNVVAGWSLQYLITYINDFERIQEMGSGPMFGSFITNESGVLLYSGIFMLLTIFIVANNIRRGIEQVSKWLMPLLFLLVIALIIIIPVSGVSTLYYENLLRFDLGALFTMDNKGNLGITEAVGQAFFSLSLGATGMITYASHMQRSANVVFHARTIVHTDTVVALLAGIMVIPLLPVASTVGADPSLVFVYLVETFKSFGSFQQFTGILFFALLSIAIITSSVSLLEPTVSYLTSERKWKRSWSSILVGGIIFLLSIPSVLSFDAGNAAIFTDFLKYGLPDGNGGISMGFFNFIFDIFGTFGLLVGVFILCMFISRVWTFKGFFEELTIGGMKIPEGYRNYLQVLIQWIIPVVIVVFFLIKIYGVLVQHEVL